MAGKGRVTGALVAAVLLVGLTLPAGASGADQPAVIAGRARASGAFIPLQVNPNFDFWPGYSLSEITNSRSRGLSGGLWPGFLVDAFAFLFGYQPQARAAMGIAESAWPSEPHLARSGTSDFGTLCAAGNDARFPLPRSAFGPGDEDGPPTARFPEPMMTGCQEMWANYGGSAPWRAAVARARSGELVTDGDAEVAGFEFGVSPKVRVGLMRTRSSTDAEGGRSVLSTSTTVLEDVEISTIAAGSPDPVVLLSLGTVRATAEVRTDGTREGTRTRWRLTIEDAEARGERVTVDERGVHSDVAGQRREDQAPVLSRDQAAQALAAAGVSVEVFEGSDRAEPVRDADGAVVGWRGDSDAGGLVVRFTRPGPPSELTGVGAEVCDAYAELDDDLFVDREDDDGAVPRARFTTDPEPNPLFEDRPPYDQLPRDLDVDQPVPPQALCPFVFLNRAVDVGVVLATADAAGMLATFPGPPPFGGIGGPDAGIVFPPDFGPIGVIEPPPGTGPAVVAPVGPDAPPPAATVLAARENLGADAASKVRLVYGGFAAVMAFVLIGRGALRNLVRL